ncbi:MAG TPA: VanZ family protein [Rhizomicrobium sp.]|nr:VanZ family protein [Rhizomicrobium sp.]
MSNRASVLKLLHQASLWLFWPVMALIVWGELRPSPPPLINHMWDKAEHFTAYFVLAAMATFALGLGRRLAYSIFGILLLGAVLEVAQRYTGRDPSLLDLIANTLGVMAGMSLAAVTVTLVEPPVDE